MKGGALFFTIQDSPFTNRGFHSLKEGVFFFTIHHSSFITHHSRFPFQLLLSPVIAGNLIQNCQLNQSVVRSASAFALYLQELQ